MKSVILALALAGATADHIYTASYVSKGDCSGEPAAYSSSVIDCETETGTKQSYKVKCSGNNTAQLLTYAETDDCSGDPTFTQDYPLDFGCESQGSTSTLMSCVDGDFVAPTPDANTYAYNGIDSCPPSGGDLTTVISYPCGTCVDYGSGTYGVYSCDSANVNMDYYMTEDCSGDSIYTYPVNTLGCIATSTQVTVTSCDMGSTDTPSKFPARENAQVAVAAARQGAEKAKAAAQAALKKAELA